MDAVEVASSPGSLSSPPHSPEQNNGGTPLLGRVSNNGVGNTSSPTPASTSATATPRLKADGNPRKKPGPKPKPKDGNVPEKKTRARKPKDPNAEPAPRKRRTKASLEAQPEPQPVKEELVQQQLQQQLQQQQPTPVPQTSRPAELPSVMQPEQPVQPIVSQAPRVLSNPEPLHNYPNLSHITGTPSTPRPASSGQLYDPIRGGLFESKPSPSVAPPPISPPLNRASASPSITSLIDPPSAANSSYQAPPRMSQQPSVTSAPVSPAAHGPRPGSVLPPSYDQQQQQQPLRTFAPPGPAVTPMEIDSDVPTAPKPSAPTPQMKKTDSGSAGTPSHSNAPTPPVKPARQKEAPPPLPTGSGLLSGTAFGNINNGANGAAPGETPGVNIWLSFPLKGKENVTINFAREVEKKYGFAALHPKIAARKERLRQMHAAGAALEKAAGVGSADDMSLDLSEPESNVEMGGMEDEGSATNNGAKKRRKRKQEDYDKEDEFIDDTELAWEQQALMAKDGFFVYSGPLVTEEKPAVERADGTVRRGRGRGRGGATRGETSGRGRGRGGGPGSRGGNTVRKPRVTKADRAMMEQEKMEREKMAANIAAKQPSLSAYPAAAAAASTTL